MERPFYKSITEWREALPSLGRKDLQSQWNVLRWSVDLGKPLRIYAVAAGGAVVTPFLFFALASDDFRSLAAAGVISIGYYLLGKAVEIQTREHEGMLQQVETAMTGKGQISGKFGSCGVQSQR